MYASALVENALMAKVPRVGSGLSEQADMVRQGDARRKALKAFMAARDLRPSDWAREANLPNANAIYNLLNGHSHSMSMRTLESLARAVNASVAEIFGERRVQQRQAAVMPVRVEAAAGRWRDTYDSDDELGFMPVPPGLVIDEAVMIRDDHALPTYRPDYMLGIRSIAGLGRRGLLHGDRVLVHRTRGGRHEVTVRQLHMAGTRDEPDVTLRFINREKAAGLASVLMVPDWPYDGESWRADDTDVVIRGRVVVAMIAED